MEDFLDDNYKIFLGFYSALSRTKSSARVVYFKVIEGQTQYFLNNQFGITKIEREKTIKLLDDAMHKFYLGAYALEQLWGVQNYLKIANNGTPSSFNENLTYQQNELTFLLASIFDQVLFCWRSFLDYYLKYLLYFLTGDYQLTMSTKKFRDSIAQYKNRNPEDKKLIQIEKYIREKVLSNTYGEKYHSWGDLLRSLRDKTAHQKLIVPTILEQSNNQGLTISWPTIRGINYSELAQLEFENKCFDLLRELFPLLYEFDWVAGEVATV